MNALFGLAFATDTPHGLTSPPSTNSQAHSSKGTPSPLLRRLRRIVGTRFQVLFHSPPGVLFTFPSRYWSAIGHQEVFRLSGWSRQIHTTFHECRPTWEVHQPSQTHTITGLSPATAQLPNWFTFMLGFLLSSPPADDERHIPQPRLPNNCRLSQVTGLASSDFARHYSRNHYCFLFLRVLRCFTSPRSLHTPYRFRRR